ncbi:succinate-semialdehyde dehydrogenase [Gordonia araii NBRC 100433]|uniref:Succinate-semialdehyde dehydrogenase n=1 Tax=Gordonia araii NBRC 100433 TaxID=1073574 RepID=G7GX30_9ACTN|nr:NAD-dependent succinate-semialdehyde dehydrogenase [Gordonia araii]NNG99142.1 NAD-dependent succinate-semialdehyde dehydrogenase [Gordonia araii NBRC 100433]GAB08155.1 succinate-semialdehyde dehydrogenase [Gordonia araii NBRC 100433]
MGEPEVSLPPGAGPLLCAVPTGLWIDGVSVDAVDDSRFDVLNPATGEPLTSVADAGPKDVVRAVDAAERAADGWASTAPRERAAVLLRAFDSVIARADDFALLMTLEMGKALPDSRNEVVYGAEFLRWFAEEAVRINGRTTVAPAGTGEIVVVKQPVGICLAITPWNFPLAMGTRKIGPALAAGATMIVKPAEDTPLTMLLLAQVFTDAGLPPGVLSVLPTSRPAELADTALTDPRMRKVSFTGSTPVGKTLLRAAADQVLRTSMELGGNAPFLVFDDADLDAAVDGAVAAKLRNGGQACTAANRFLVQNSIREEFTAALARRFDTIRTGPGWDVQTELGPMVNAAQRDRVSTLVSRAVDDGAEVHSGGPGIAATASRNPGFYYPATVISGVAPSAPVSTDEVFGPVATIVGFDDEQEALDLANATPFGLASYFYSADLSRCMRVSAALQSGIVGVNRGIVSDPAAPFGGIKQSGIGSEGGSEGIEEYLDTKYIALPPIG